MKKLVMTVVILMVLVVGLAGYVVFDKYQQARSKTELGIYQQGIQVGYQQAIVQVMQQAATCQAVPLYAQNVTMNLVAVECLKQAQASAKNQS